jgi:hypothetical protein
MYYNVVQSSLKLRSEQRFYFISPHHKIQCILSIINTPPTQATAKCFDVPTNTFPGICVLTAAETHSLSLQWKRITKRRYHGNETSVTRNQLTYSCDRCSLSRPREFYLRSRGDKKERFDWTDRRRSLQPPKYSDQG